jgi:2-polyprenyl-3-methyl-5-hydroxy-6-metoxy-1,4-benzoquinol methylase
MNDEDYVKRYYAASNTISRWWHPESCSPRENPFLPFREIFAQEATDAVAAGAPGGKSILDAGTGDGRLLQRLVQTHAGRICALDISREMLVLAKTRHPESAEVEFVCGDVEQLPFKDHAFELAFCIQTTVHLPRPDVAMLELARVVVPAGKLILDITNRNAASVFRYLRGFKSFLSFLNSTLRFLALYFPLGALKGAGGPWRQYSLKEIAGIASLCDLETLEQMTYGGRKPIYTLMVFRKRTQDTRRDLTSSRPDADNKSYTE